MLSRRQAGALALLGPPALPLLGPARATTAPPLDLTPDCADGEEVTVAQTEGPFFTPGAPQRHDLTSDAPDAAPLLIGGFVLDPACRPIPGALLELWHADGAGRYDNRGFRGRAHAFSDAAGRWWFRTIVPGLYPGRTRHYHLKVQRPHGRVLTTQLYFPDEPQNRRDRIFDPRLLLRIDAAEEGRLGRFDFVVA
jgi:protocatechuate 3,4-dioxygenase beta subunit